MPNDMPRDMGGQNGGPAMTTGDFSLVGFSSDGAGERTERLVHHELRQSVRL